MDHVPGGPSPLPVPVAVELCSAPRDGTHHTIAFIGQPTGMMTHWRPKKPIHCPGPAHCPKENHKLAATWKGYACAQLWRDPPFNDWVPVVYEVTVSLWELLKTTPLKGQMWDIWRVKGPHEHKEVIADRLEEIQPCDLYKPFDIMAVLVRIYKTTEFVLDVPCPVPDRIFMLPTKGAPPSTAKTVVEKNEEIQRSGATSMWKAHRQNGTNHAKNGRH